MKIVVVTQYFWPENFHINEVVRGLTERGHKVTVITGFPNYPHGHFFKGYGLNGPFRETHDGARVFRIPIIPRGRGGGLRLALNYASFSIAASALAPFLQVGSIDAILVYQASPVTVAIPALILSRLKHAPAVLWVQDLWPESLVATGTVSSATVLAWVERLVRYIYLHSDLVLTKSYGFEKQVRRIAGSKPTVRYFPDWAGSVNPAATTQRQFVDLPRGFRILFAGNIGVAQDFETILGAAELLRDHADINWLVLGDGSQRTWVEGRIRSARLSSVHLLGQHPPETMPYYFGQADVLLVTLKNEGAFALTVPGKLRAYLASGRPIVAALPGEGADLVRQAAAGVACEPGNAESLARAVLSLYEAPIEERLAMGARGLAFYKENYDRDVLLTRLESWLSEVAQKGSRADGYSRSSENRPYA